MLPWDIKTKKGPGALVAEVAALVHRNRSSRRATKQQCDITEKEKKRELKDIRSDFRTLKPGSLPDTGKRKRDGNGRNSLSQNRTPHSPFIDTPADENTNGQKRGRTRETSKRMRKLHKKLRDIERLEQIDHGLLQVHAPILFCTRVSY